MRLRVRTPLLASALLLASLSAHGQTPGAEVATDAATSPVEVEEAEEPVDPAEPEEPPPAAIGGAVLDPANVETPAFPSEDEVRIGDAFRIRLGSLLLPRASFDGFDVDLYRPELRLRTTLPLSERAVLQLDCRGRAALYDSDAASSPLASEGLDTFYAADITLQGGYRLNQTRSLFFEGEIWSLLAAASWTSRWEPGAFSEGMTGGGTIGAGYELRRRFRVGLGASLRSRLDSGGIRVSPVFTLRWSPTDRFTVRNRGLGLQLEYKLTDDLEVFATSYSDGGQFRLDRREGLPDDLTFRDRFVTAGMGFEWKYGKHFRVNAEVGAVAWRELRLRSDDLGTLSSTHGDPSAYLDLRFEVRP